MGARVTTPVIADQGYLTPQQEWGDVERGNPLPYTLPPERRREIGLERDTWRLEVLADPESDAEIEAPLSISFDQLLEIGQQHGVRILKGITCNNLGDPLGMGLWEGVPLRVLVWMARPCAISGASSTTDTTTRTRCRCSAARCPSGACSKSRLVICR